MTGKLWSAAFVMVALGVAYGADTDIEKLKAAANEARATLAVSESKGDVKGVPYLTTQFAMDTGAAKFLMRYQSFLGEDAAKNPDFLTDCASGYGMVQPRIELGKPKPAPVKVRARVWCVWLCVCLCLCEPGSWLD